MGFTDLLIALGGIGEGGVILIVLLVAWLVFVVVRQVRARRASDDE
jgi:hypothetical protein